MAYLVATYTLYAAAAIGLTIWLARTLFHNGALFLEDVFPDRPALAAAVNRLLVVGFFMLNLGYAFLILRADAASDGTEAFEVLASKLGLLLVSLGVIHFVNLAVFQSLRRRARAERQPPVPPHLRMPVPPQPWPAAPAWAPTGPTRPPAPPR